jgi:hypothetical protein
MLLLEKGKSPLPHVKNANLLGSLAYFKRNKTDE